MASSQHRSKAKKLKLRNFFLFIGACGTVILLTGLYSKYRVRILSFNQKPPEQVVKVERLAVPTFIRIKEADIGLPVENGQIVNGVWEVSEDAATHLSNSARPGENGNIVIYGHNKKKIFGNLIGRNLMGNEIEIMTDDGKVYVYKVSEIKTVSPNDIEVVMPTDYEILTIYTCTGFLDSKRLVIKALPKD